MSFFSSQWSDPPHTYSRYEVLPGLLPVHIKISGQKSKLPPLHKVFYILCPENYE